MDAGCMEACMLVESRIIDEVVQEGMDAGMEQLVLSWWTFVAVDRR